VKFFKRSTHPPCKPKTTTAHVGDDASYAASIHLGTIMARYLSMYEYLGLSLSSNDGNNQMLDVPIEVHKFGGDQHLMSITFHECTFV
jgi:hypothetical protein